MGKLFLGSSGPKTKTQFDVVPNMYSTPQCITIRVYTFLLAHAPHQSRKRKVPITIESLNYEQSNSWARSTGSLKFWYTIEYEDQQHKLC